MAKSRRCYQFTAIGTTSCTNYAARIVSQREQRLHTSCCMARRGEGGAGQAVNRAQYGGSCCWRNPTDSNYETFALAGATACWVGDAGGCGMPSTLVCGAICDSASFYSHIISGQQLPPLPAQSKQQWQCTQSQGEAPAAVATERVQVRRERGRDTRRARQWAKGHASLAAERAHEGNGRIILFVHLARARERGHGPRETLGRAVA